MKSLKLIAENISNGVSQPFYIVFKWGEVFWPFLSKLSKLKILVKPVSSSKATIKLSSLVFTSLILSFFQSGLFKTLEALARAGIGIEFSLLLFTKCPSIGMIGMTKSLPNEIISLKTWFDILESETIVFSCRIQYEHPLVQTDFIGLPKLLTGAV